MRINQNTMYLGMFKTNNISKITNMTGNIIHQIKKVRNPKYNISKNRFLMTKTNNIVLLKRLKENLNIN